MKCTGPTRIVFTLLMCGLIRNASASEIVFWSVERPATGLHFYNWLLLGGGLSPFEVYSPAGETMLGQTIRESFADFHDSVVGTWQVHRDSRVDEFELASFDASFFTIPILHSPSNGDTFVSGTLIEMDYDPLDADSIGLGFSGEFDGEREASFDPLGYTLTLADGVIEDDANIGVSGARSHDLITPGPELDGEIDPIVGLHAFSLATVTITSVPEPSAVLLSGLVGVGLLSRRSRSALLRQ